MNVASRMHGYSFKHQPQRSVALWKRANIPRQDIPHSPANREHTYVRLARFSQLVTQRHQNYTESLMVAETAWTRNVTA